MQGALEWLRHSDNLRRDTLVAMRGFRSRACTVLAANIALTMLAACTSNNPVSPDATVACVASDPADSETGITQERADTLLGRSEADAQRCAEELGWAFRIGRRDDEYFALTMDYSAQRVNVEVDDDVVTLVSVG